MMPKTSNCARKQLVDVFGWFWNFTSFGGFTQSRDSDNSISKCAWFILALFGYGITFFQCYTTINTFFKNEINTKMTFQTGNAFTSTVGFPSVTVCNSNRVHCGRLYDAIINCTRVRFYQNHSTNLVIVFQWFINIVIAYFHLI